MLRKLFQTLYEYFYPQETEEPNTENVTVMSDSDDNVVVSNMNTLLKELEQNAKSHQKRFENALFIPPISHFVEEKHTESNKMPSSRRKRSKKHKKLRK